MMKEFYFRMNYLSESQIVYYIFFFKYRTFLKLNTYFTQYLLNIFLTIIKIENVHYYCKMVIIHLKGYKQCHKNGKTEAFYSATMKVSLLFFLTTDKIVLVHSTYITSKNVYLN